MLLAYKSMWTDISKVAMLDLLTDQYAMYWLRLSQQDGLWSDGDIANF